jgi:DNA polymerase/3'-5' exonuclease PolX
MIAGKTEKDIYKKLGLDYIEQELREKSRGNRTCQKS